MRSLLIIACSKRKARGMRVATAWDLYDGVVYRMLKKRLGPRNNWPPWLDVLIVSARYGVIPPGKRICTYDQTMPKNGEPERWAGKLHRMIARQAYDFVHVNLGRRYLTAVGNVAGLFPKAEVAFAAGGIGRRVAATAAWVSARFSTGQTVRPS
jgi:hypothetical protein